MKYCYIFYYTTPGVTSKVEGTEPINIKCLNSDMLLNFIFPTGRTIINMRNVTYIEEIIEEERVGNEEDSVQHTPII